MGGEGFEYNPWGKGYLAQDDVPNWDNTSPLPNIEDPTSMMKIPHNQWAPAGYGPQEVTWPQRSSKVGKKYGKKWEKERYPEPAVDMDPTYYNAAADDQQLKSGFWNGDEDFVITNMHPDKPEIRSSMPQIRPRCFILQREENRERWREVSLTPETVWLFPNVERGILISRGLIEIDTLYGIDVDTVLLAWEFKNGQTRSPENYRESIRLREDKESGDEWSMREDDLSPPEGIPEEEPMFVDEDDEEPDFGPLLERSTQQANAMVDKAKGMFAKIGLDPSEFMGGMKVKTPKLPVLPKFEKMSDIAGVLAFAKLEGAKCDVTLDQMVKEGTYISKTKPEAEKKIADKAREICKRCGQDYDELLAKSKANPSPKKPAMSRFKDVLNKAKTQLADHPDKVKKLDFALGKLDKAQLKMAMNDPVMKAMDRESAHYDEVPPLPSAEEQSELRQIVQARYVAGESFEEAELQGVNLSGLDLSGANFKGANLNSANLTKTNFTGADLSETTLARADCTEAVMVEANLESAGLGLTIFHKTDLSGANLNESTLDQTNFSEAMIAGASLKIGMCMNSNFQDADLSGVLLEESDFVESRFNQAKFIKANLSKCSFMDCNLIGADFSEGILLETMFTEVKANGAIFRQAKMKDANAHMDSDFSKGIFTQVDGESMNFSETKLMGADFTLARLGEADFGESSLNNAIFDRVIAREANFTDCDLTDASFIGADLMQSSLQSARLTRAQFENSHLFGADLTFAHMEDTKFRGAVIKRTVLEED